MGRDVPLRIDSHQHLHHIPFVFHIVADLCQDLPAIGMRLVREPFSLRTHALARHTLGGVGKHALLKVLSARHRLGLATRGVATEDWFVGALLMGRLSPRDVDDSLRRIHALSSGDAATVAGELAFHPGGAAPGEEAMWVRYPWLVTYYSSPWHRFESEGLRSPEMTACLKRWRSITTGSPAGSTTES